MNKYFYCFYFKKENCGAIILAFDKQLDISNIDECINFAFKSGALPKEYVNNIDYIEKLSNEEMKEMGMDNLRIHSIF